MLTKRIAAELLKGPNRHLGRVKLVFHFVSPELPTEEISADNPQARQSRLAKVASDLLYGILQQDGIFDGCKAELETQGDRFFTNPSSLWKVLGKAIEDCHTDPVCILIDGIDGLKPTLCKDLITRIVGLADIPKVKILLSSRVVPEVSNNISRHMEINLDGNDSVKGDVETFINYRVNALREWDDGLKERVRETLLAKAEGIFLWASLAIENLACYCSGPDFDTFLEESPPELEGVYQKMLRRIKERRGWKKVLDMIRCVALAVRPLTFDELGHFLVYIEGKANSKHRSSRGGTSTQSRPKGDDIEKSIQSCQGFLRSVAGTVSIVHHTAIEYLFDEERDDGLPECSKSGLDFIISWECFQYLHAAFDDRGEAQNGGVGGHSDKPRDSNSKREHQEEESGETGRELSRKCAQEAAAKQKYLRYAAESWFIHARRSIEISKPEDKFCDEETHNWLKYRFFDTGDIIRKPWIELCGDPRMEVLEGVQTPLHIAVCLGLIPLVELALLRFEEGTNSTQSPLHLAAKFMSGAYNILIAKGGQWLLTDPDKDGNTPLHQATIFGHSPMLKGLVEKFTGDTAYSKAINMENNCGNTPLHLAVQFDYPDMVEFLAKNGADITIPNKIGLTATALGKSLGRGDSLNILKRLEEIQQQEPAEKPVEEPGKELLKRHVKEDAREPGEELVALEDEDMTSVGPRMSEEVLVVPEEEIVVKRRTSLWKTLGTGPVGLWRRLCGFCWGDPR